MERKNIKKRYRPRAGRKLKALCKAVDRGMKLCYAVQGKISMNRQ